MKDLLMVITALVAGGVAGMMFEMYLTRKNEIQAYDEGCNIYKKALEKTMADDKAYIKAIQKRNIDLTNRLHFAEVELAEMRKKENQQKKIDNSLKNFIQLTDDFDIPADYFEGF